MNIERLEYLANWLEQGAKHERITFGMAYGIRVQSEDFNPKMPTECNTSCCIAGAAVQFFTDKQEVVDFFKRGFSQGAFDPYGDGDDNSVEWLFTFDKARELLGLTYEQACDLFAPGNEGRPHSDMLDEHNDPQWAARTIRHLVESGSVDWEAVKLP